MDFVTTVIIIIVTALTNLLVSGGIGFYFQRKIGNSFAEELEQFKSSLQKSIIEHQIKFSRNYPKTLEVIETFNQKFLAYREQWYVLSDEILRSSTADQEDIDKKEEEVNSTLFELNIWFQNNRIYLAEPSISELDDIIEKSDTLGQLLLAARYIPRAPNPDLARLLNKTAKNGGLVIEPINPENRISSYLYVEELRNQALELSTRLETIYKSVAEAQ